MATKHTAFPSIALSVARLNACADWNEEQLIRCYQNGDHRSMGRLAEQAKALRRMAWLLAHNSVPVKGARSDGSHR